MTDRYGLLATAAVSAAAVPSTLVPVPALARESVIEHPSARTAAPSTEVLVEISGSEITVLHSYLQSSWRHAVPEQRLRAATLDRLRSAARGLPTDFGLAVFDAWRPLALQRELFDTITSDAAGPTNMVAPPSTDPATPPPHLTGGAVDLTLSWQGTPLALGTGFDEFNELTATRAFEQVAGPVRALRRLLFHCLSEQGFVVLAEEWWHFEYGTRLWSAVSGNPVRYGPAGI
jgi:D-alanyl-D-alanine dipeptidase